MPAAPELRLAIEEKRGVMDIFTLWMPRIALVLAFVFIGGTKFNASVLRLRFATRSCYGVCDKIYADNLKAMPGEIQRVCACAASQIERTTVGKLFVLYQLHYLRRGDICVPRRSACEITPLKKHPHEKARYAVIHN